MAMMQDQLSLGCSRKRAAHISVLAFRCAWSKQATRDRASAEALKTYRSLQPRDDDASDRVVEALVDAIRLSPHWVSAEG